MPLDSQINAADRAASLASDPAAGARAIDIALAATQQRPPAQPFWKRTPVVAGAGVLAVTLAAAAAISNYPSAGDTNPTVAATPQLPDGRMCGVGVWVVPQDSRNTHLEDRGISIVEGNPLMTGEMFDRPTLGLKIAGGVGASDEPGFDSRIAPAVTTLVEGSDVETDFMRAVAEVGGVRSADDLVNITDLLVEDYMERIEAAGYEMDNNWSLVIGADCEAP